MSDSFFFGVAMGIAFLVGVLLGDTIDKPVNINAITQAQERCVDAAGLKSLTMEGKFTCNNGLRGELPSKE